MKKFKCDIVKESSFVIIIWSIEDNQMKETLSFNDIFDYLKQKEENCMILNTNVCKGTFNVNNLNYN